MPNFLKKVFPDLSDNEMALISGGIKTKTCGIGETVFREDDPRDELYIVKSGKVDIIKTIDGEKKHLYRCSENDIISEGLLLDGNKHTTTCKSVIPATLISLSRSHIEKIMENEPRLAIKILKRIALVPYGRLRGPAICKARKEKDSLGYIDVPGDAYYGAQTERARRNFQITGIPLSHFPDLVKSLAMIKKAAALTNIELENMEAPVGMAISDACDEIIEGDPYLNGQFIVDVIQGGAGTSTNMNANEVIATRAREILDSRENSEKQTKIQVDPNDHVNMCQSTNDVYPSAIRLTIVSTYGNLIQSMEHLIQEFRKKAEEFSDVIKIGRTQLQDAVPMTLGQQFGAYGETIEEDIDKVHRAARLFEEINLGGTAIGTGVTADTRYCDNVVSKLNDVVKTALSDGHIQLKPSKDLVEATWDTGAFVLFSGVLKRLAVKLSKICNDLRLLNSGPLGGFRDIRLPPVQPGSSIMPGKVNPVIPEAVNQVAFQVIGNDITVTMAAEAGQLQLNAFEPVIAFGLFQSMQILPRAITILADHINGIEMDEKDRAFHRKRVEESPGLATFLIPKIGYGEAVRIAHEVLETGRSVKDIVFEEKIMGREEWEAFMKPENLTQPYRMKKRE